MTLKLGLSGIEQTLSEVSRSLDGPSIDEISQSGRSSDGTLHIDLVTFKRSWQISYAKVTEGLFNTILNIYNLQITNNDFLSFIIPDSDGTESTYTVKMSAPSAGGLTPRDEFYSASVSFNLDEV